MNSRRFVIAGVSLLAALTGVVTLTLSNAQTPTVTPKVDVTTNDPVAQPAFVQAGIDKVWARTTGSSSVIIADIGTGIDTQHPEITGQLVLPHNVVANNDDVNDANGQGTRTGGTVIAKANNGIGFAGGCSGCRLMPVKATVDANNTIAEADATNAFHYAVDNGAKIIMYSYSGTTEKPAEEEAINYARSKGVLVFASAGNTPGSGLRYPAAADNALSVTALDTNGAVASVASYGSFVKIGAPGTGVMVVNWPDRSDSGYIAKDGSGQAVTVAASVAGLLLSAFPQATDVQLWDALTKTAGSCCDGKIGGGKIDAVAAFNYLADIFKQPHLGEVVTPTPTPPTPTPPTPTPPTPTPPTPTPPTPTPKKGDLNNDGKVNLTDLSTLLSNWGKNYSAGDFNKNGKVDLPDLSVLLSNWGK